MSYTFSQGLGILFLFFPLLIIKFNIRENYEVNMIETSQTTEKLDAAMAKAQGEIKTAIKDKINPHFRSSYADITGVWDSCRQALSKYGISVTQWPVHSDDNRVHMITRVAHAGEWIQSHFSVPVQKQDAHGYGSAITYLKRFMLAAAIGVVADEDDDGNEATGREVIKQTNDVKVAQPVKQISDVMTNNKPQANGGISL